MSEYDLGIRDQWLDVEGVWKDFFYFFIFASYPLQSIHGTLIRTRDQIPRPNVVAYRWMGFERMSQGVANYALDKLEAEILKAAREKPRPLVSYYEPDSRHWFQATRRVESLIEETSALRARMADLWQVISDLEAGWKNYKPLYSGIWPNKLKELETRLDSAKKLRKDIDQINAGHDLPKLLPYHLRIFQLYVDTVLVEPLEALVQAIRLHYGAEAGAFHGLPE